MQKNGARGSRMEEKSCLRNPNSITPVSTARNRDKMLCSRPGHTPRTKPQAPISLMSPPPMARAFPCVSNAANRYGPPVTRSPATEAAGRSSIKPQTKIMAESDWESLVLSYPRAQHKPTAGQIPRLLQSEDSWLHITDPLQIWVVQYLAMQIIEIP